MNSLTSINEYGKYVLDLSSRKMIIN